MIQDIYIDPGFSGSNLKRPAIERLVENVKLFDVVLVYKLDRLSRSQKDTLYLIEEKFLPNNVDFVSLLESFDTSSSFGRAMIGILSVFAQLEREQIKERTTMGKIGRAKKGLFHGGKHLPIGYDRIDGKLIVNPYEAEQIRLVYDLYLQGYGYKSICQHMTAQGYRHKAGGWVHHKTVYNVLRNNVYLGIIKFGDEETPGSHEPIISPEKWQAVKRIREKNAENGLNLSRGHILLSGFIYCEKCGSKMYAINTNDHQQASYTCYSARKRDKLYKGLECDAKYWRLELLEAMVDYQVRQLAFDEKQLGRVIQKNITPQATGSAGTNLKYIDDRVKDIDRQISKLMDLYQDDLIPKKEVSERITVLHEEKTLLISQREKVTFEQENDVSTDEIRLILSSVATLWDLADVQQKRVLMSALIRRINVTDDGPRIEWAFNPKPKIKAAGI